MNVASLELCKELYELSRWKEADFVYYSNAGEVIAEPVWPRQAVFDKPTNIPAYDLGYLLRKLPKGTRLNNGIRWNCSTGHQAFTKEKVTKYADNPEDAACKLAIELFNQGILK